jgi:hypothetical protein
MKKVLVMELAYQVIETRVLSLLSFLLINHPYFDNSNFANDQRSWLPEL